MTAGKIQVRAVGTVFAVKYGSRAVEVRVTEGKVEVRRLDTTLFADLLNAFLDPRLRPK